MSQFRQINCFETAATALIVLKKKKGAMHVMRDCLGSPRKIRKIKNKTHVLYMSHVYVQKL